MVNSYISFWFLLTFQNICPFFFCSTEVGFTSFLSGGFTEFGVTKKIVNFATVHQSRA